MDPRFNAFYMLTGVTFLSFASGFGVCLFNLDTIDQCVDVANNWVDVFLDIGNHIIIWAITLVKTILGFG
ncbi:MAG: hypothetical protein ACK502_00190 [Alphaproteobacteria bacterium]